MPDTVTGLNVFYFFRQGPVGVGIKTEENFIDSVVYVDNFLAVKTSGEDYISVFTLPPLDPFPNKRPIQFSFFNTLRFRKASREDVFMDGSKGEFSYIFILIFAGHSHLRNQIIW